MSHHDAMLLEYPLCTRPLSELTVMRAAELEPRTHHRGRYLPVKIIYVASKLAEIAAVDGHNEKVTLLVPHLNPLASSWVGMPVNSIFFVKEPYAFEAWEDDGPLRAVIGYLSKIVWAAERIDYIPSCWQSEYSFPGKTAEQLRAEALKAYKSGLYHDAILMSVTHEEDPYMIPFFANLCSSNTIALSRTTLPWYIDFIRVNRSLAYLEVKRYEAAYHDIYNMNPASVELRRRIGWDCACLALYGLGRFEMCHTEVERLRPFRTDEKFTKFLRKAEARLSELNSGSYDFAGMQMQALKGDVNIECATYSKNVDIRLSQGRGRGLFAAQAVKAGELVLAEPAFSYTGHDSATVVSVNRPSRQSRMDILATLVIQKLFRNPSLAPLITALYPDGSDQLAQSKQRVDGQALIDSHHIRRVVRYNAFESPMSSFVRHGDALRMEGRFKDAVARYAAFEGLGLWPKAAYINHSCIGNTHRSFIGNVLLLRATRDIDAGEELLFNYADCCPGCDRSQAKLRRWDFRCSCAFCQERQQTPGDVVGRRQSLVAQILATKIMKRARSLRAGPTDNTAQLEELLFRMDELFRPPLVPEVEWPAMVPLVEMAQALGRLGYTHNFYMLGRAGEARRIRATGAIIVSLDQLHAMGFVTENGDPREEISDTQPAFKVTQWGCLFDVSMALHLWLRLTLAYQYAGLPKQHADAARAYLVKVYAMVFGETASFAWSSIEDWGYRLMVRELESHGLLLAL